MEVSFWIWNLRSAIPAFITGRNKTPKAVPVHAGGYLSQPAGVPHNVIGRSDDLELIEINPPAQFGTFDLAAPAGGAFPVPGARAASGIGIGCRTRRADRAASGYVNAEQRARGAANAVRPVVHLAEGWDDEAAFAKRIHAALGPQALASHSLSGAANLGIYAHQLTLVASR